MMIQKRNSYRAVTPNARMMAGFTIIELLVVISIIGLLASLFTAIR